jgi:hypothetical protein
VKKNAGDAVVLQVFSTPDVQLRVACVCLSTANSDRYPGERQQDIGILSPMQEKGISMACRRLPRY